VLSLTLVLAASAASADDFTEVEVVANILKGRDDVNEDDIKSGLKDANELLKQAKVRLVLKKTNRMVSDEGNNDGITTADERDKLKKKGEAETDAVVGKGKGFKLTIAKEVDPTNTGRAGLTTHNVPVSFIEFAMNFGPNIAHEFFHAFTLGPGHVVVADPLKKADATGHTDHPDNVMDPHAGGTELTPDQIKEIQRKAAERGTTKKKDGSNDTPEPKQQKSGEAPDPRSGENDENSGIPPKGDLRRCGMLVDPGGGTAWAWVQLHGPFPVGLPTQSQCQLFVDADANPLTGEPQLMDSVAVGAEYVVHVFIQGSGVGNPQATGQVRVVASGQLFPLDTAFVETQHEIADVAPGQGTPSATPELDELFLRFGANLLGALPAHSVVGVRMTDLLAGTVDASVFVVRDWPPAAPQLALSSYGALPGATIHVTGAGFAALTPVRIFVDDSLVAVTTSTAAGAVAASFAAPPAAPDYYWIDARDTTGQGDFSILHVEPPSFPAVTGWGVVALTLLLIGGGAWMLRGARGVAVRGA
jgi:hypothetical protein